jgi:hypothetical protein
MQRYGFGEEAATVFTAIVQAAAQFEHFRLPEVFAGYDKSHASRPVAYPVACNPQAWSAGAVPYMLASSLGLRPDAWNHRLRIVRPHLPSWLREVTVRGLRVGQAEVELHFERTPRGTLVALGGSPASSPSSAAPSRVTRAATFGSLDSTRKIGGTADEPTDQT